MVRSETTCVKRPPGRSANQEESFPTGEEFLPPKGAEDGGSLVRAYADGCSAVLGYGRPDVCLEAGRDDGPLPELAAQVASFARQRHRRGVVHRRLVLHGRQRGDSSGIVHFARSRRSFWTRVHWVAGLRRMIGRGINRQDAKSAEARQETIRRFSLGAPRRSWRLGGSLLFPTTPSQPAPLRRRLPAVP
jgi:hypothetical protein